MTGLQSRKTSIAEVRSMSERGVSCRQAARRMNVHHETLRRRAKNAGVKFPVSPTRDKIIAAIAAGAATTLEIEYMTGIPRDVSAVIVRKAEKMGLVERIFDGKVRRNICWKIADQSKSILQ